MGRRNAWIFAGVLTAGLAFGIPALNVFVVEPLRSMDEPLPNIVESIEDAFPERKMSGVKIIDGAPDQNKADALFKIINEKRNWYGSGSLSYDSEMSKQATIAAKWYDENGVTKIFTHLKKV